MHVVFGGRRKDRKVKDTLREVVTPDKVRAEGRKVGSESDETFLPRDDVLWPFLIREEGQGQGMASELAVALQRAWLNCHSQVARMLQAS